MSDTHTGESPLSAIGHFVSQWRRELLILLALLLTLVAPFLLKPKTGSTSSGDAEKLVIITPHNETIRREFADAFARHMQEEHDRKVYVDWRNPGGTSEIAKVLSSEFSASFAQEWKAHGDSDAPWNEVAKDFNNRKLPPTKPGAPPSPGARAREHFLASETSVGIDLFFGGGAYDFYVQAGMGHLVAADPSGEFGIAPLFTNDPTEFNETIFPISVSGEPFRDENNRWIGTCISTFGICFNLDSLARLGIEKEPTQWEDLASPKLEGEIALADPTKSGSSTKAFEMLVQQQMAITVSSEAYVDEAAAVSVGWEKGLQLIQKIAANSRYFADGSSKIPHDVAQGNATAGMSIDFYGRTYNELHKKHEGGTTDRSRIQYLTPIGGSSIGVDPIAMVRGAPNPEIAHQFIQFVLSKKGQRLWNYRAGTEGGPVLKSIRRLPVRTDIYTPEELAHFSDPNVLPYETADQFTYHQEWTGSLFDPLRLIIRLMCIDTHDELKTAWKALIENDFPPEATAHFSNLAAVSYEKATGEIDTALRSGNKLNEVQLARDLAAHFRQQYQQTTRLAKAGK